MNEELIRARFEKWIRAPPFEHLCDRQGDSSAWPENNNRVLTGFGFGAMAYCSRMGHAPSFTQSKDYQDWARGKPPEINVMAYFDFIDERRRATRLEF